jgi:hypothetical protein
MCNKLLLLTLQVGLDPRWSDRLGQDTDAPLDQPRDENDCSLDVVLLGDLDNHLVLTEVLAVGSTERRVCLGEDVLLLQPGDELWLRALDGKLDLV